MKISSIIKVVTAVAAVAATGAIIYSKVKIKEIEKNETIEPEEKEEVIEKTEKVAKVASYVAVGAAVGFVASAICGREVSNVSAKDLGGPETAKLFLKDNLESWVPNLQKAGLSDSVIGKDFSVDDTSRACGKFNTSIANKYFPNNDKKANQLLTDLDGATANGMYHGVKNAIHWCEQAEEGFHLSSEGV